MMQKKWGSMERQLLERMIGAVVLLVALVLIVPAILDGGDDDGGGEASPSVADVGRKSIPESCQCRTLNSAFALCRLYTSHTSDNNDHTCNRMVP